jgi:hypothetical protein
MSNSPLFAILAPFRRRRHADIAVPKMAIPHRD